MKIEKKICGKIDSKDVISYKLINDNGMYATFLNLGGTNIELGVKNKKNEIVDVVMAYNDIEHIKEAPCYLGVIVARNANRIANACARISNVDYKLDDNENGNNLHSGNDYFHSKILEAKIKEDDNEVSVEFVYHFIDMQQGYPGNMDFSVCYILNNENELKIRYKAVSDKDTIFNPTFHAYFNFSGHNFGRIGTHKIKINADKCTYVNENLIPEKIVEVIGTKLDFYTDFRYMNDGIDDDFEQIKKCGGFDHNFVVKDYDGNIKKVAEVNEDMNGIKMEVFSDLPGVQFYSGNFINCPYTGKNDAKYNKRGAFCLETQYFPNAINDDRFISPLLKKDIKKEYNTIYKFSNI